MDNLITKYFPDLTADQDNKFRLLGDLYADWNSRINVISRKDIEHLYLHHILHSLGIAKIIHFNPGTEILDVGTGGGFPGIPLAILLPECRFTLVDSIAKKIRVVEAVAAETGLDNVKALWTRAEEIPSRFDYVTGRAVTDLGQFARMVEKNIRRKGSNSLPNGILYLKGELTGEERSSIGPKVKEYKLSQYFTEPYFETKCVIHLHNF